MERYIGNTTFGTFKLFTSIARPLAVSGAMIGLSWYIFYRKLWLPSMFPNDTMWRDMTGYGIFWTGAFAAFWNPNMWLWGFIFGSFNGLIANFYFDGNYYSNRNT